MSQLFVQSADASWAAVPLGDAAHDFTSLLLPGASVGSVADLDEAPAVRCLSFRAGDAERWLLVAGVDASLRVNGIPLGAVGARVLSDRDEICLPGVGTAFYSTETLAVALAFPGSERPVFCGRCRQVIEQGRLSVQCGQCRVWHHQDENLGCWRYSECCSCCSATTAFDAGFRWTPQE